jgi:hypothetical protein
MDLSNPPWYRRWSFLLAGVIGLAAITAVVGWRGLSRADAPETTVTTQPTVTVPTTTTTTIPPTSLPSKTTTNRPSGVLWSETGGDVSKKSPGFRAPGRWRIEWSFECASFRKLGGGNFKITGDGAFERVEIQDFAVNGRGSRVFPSGGFGHLLIDSVCEEWTVTVMDA